LPYSGGPDLLNAFVDVMLWGGERDNYLRIGRQELLYGSQRLISPLARTMRKVYREG
jgi:hypothetical protein